ncbi:MAG: YggT family protein [Alphaproteobacteria bacterium]|nr:YggT family protein [Alphaproteobacteria bacterium]NCQ66845.1 YggT family protein [Alphaproteobacteria bacterium]NCT07413.1 YggT family protein [Alphaproteobacteria bacterium]
MDIIFVPLLNILRVVIDLYVWVVIIHIIMSWLVSFNVINVSNQFVMIVNNVLYAATEPVLQRIRRFLPTFSGLDLSPLVLILILMFISNVVARLASKLI